VEDVGILNDHLVYFTAIWYSLLLFHIFYGYLVYFSPFWYVVPSEIWQPRDRPGLSHFLRTAPTNLAIRNWFQPTCQKWISQFF
jgi:hypothetical protein